MVTIAIVAILASLALPQYQRFLLKTKRTEAITLLKGLHLHQMSYFATYDQFYPPNANPLGSNNVNPDVYNPLFGMGPWNGSYFDSNLKWRFQTLSGRGSGNAGDPYSSVGYSVSMQLNLDEDNFPYVDLYILKFNIPPYPDCPDGIPSLASNDLNNGVNLCG